MKCFKCNHDLVMEPSSHHCSNNKCELYLINDTSRFIKKTKNDLIDEIVESFDFDKAHQVMALLNWTWRDEGVPSVRAIKASAIRLLSDSYESAQRNDSEFSISTGGLEAYCSKELDYMTLKFVLTEWDTWVE